MRTGLKRECNPGADVTHGRRVESWTENHDVTRGQTSVERETSPLRLEAFWASGKRRKMGEYLHANLQLWKQYRVRAGGGGVLHPQQRASRQLAMRYVLCDMHRCWMCAYFNETGWLIHWNKRTSNKSEEARGTNPAGYRAVCSGPGLRFAVRL